MMRAWAAARASISMVLARPVIQVSHLHLTYAMIRLVHHNQKHKYMGDTQTHLQPRF